MGVVPRTQIAPISPGRVAVEEKDVAASGLLAVHVSGMWKIGSHSHGCVPTVPIDRAGIGRNGRSGIHHQLRVRPRVADDLSGPGYEVFFA